IRDFHVTGVQTCALPISDLAVPEQFLNQPRVNPSRKEHGGRRVTQIMEADTGQSSFFQQWVKRLVPHICWRQWGPDGCRKDQPVVLPSLTGRQAFFRLPHLVPTKGRQRERGQWYSPPRPLGLRRRIDRFSLNPLKLSPHG